MGQVHIRNSVLDLCVAACSVLMKAFNRIHPSIHQSVDQNMGGGAEEATGRHHVQTGSTPESAGCSMLLPVRIHMHSFSPQGAGETVAHRQDYCKRDW